MWFHYCIIGMYMSEGTQAKKQPEVCIRQCTVLLI